MKRGHTPEMAPASGSVEALTPHAEGREMTARLFLAALVSVAPDEAVEAPSAGQAQPFTSRVLERPNCAPPLWGR